MTKVRVGAKEAAVLDVRPRQGRSGDVTPNRRTNPGPDASEAEIVNVRRRQDRSVETRRKILESALAEFAAVGFEGASTRSIAERAQVPHGLVTYHFETKLGVWQAVIERALSDSLEQWEIIAEKLRDSDPETILRAFYRNFIEFSATRPETNWIFSHEISGQTDRLHWLLERIRGRDLEFTLGLIRQLQAAGRYVQGDPGHLHFLFIGAASRVFAFAPEIEHYVGVSPFDQAFIDRHVEVCVGLFFRDPPDKPKVGLKSRTKGRWRSGARPRG